MFNYPNRFEERQERFYYRAEHKLFSSEEILYPGEVKKLFSQGFKVKKVKDFDISRNLGVYEVSWQSSFGLAVPHIVYSYINGIIGTYPHSAVNNFAQELYVISHKAISTK
ncbi:MAG: hypothetical protein J5507_02790 [Clostridia bacterium]|nr:hypothetical protein [Clostridia bacterium]